MIFEMLITGGFVRVSYLPYGFGRRIRVVIVLPCSKRWQRRWRACEIRFGGAAAAGCGRLSEFEIGVESHSDTKIKRTAFVSFFPHLPLYCLELARSIYCFQMFSPHLTPTSEDAAYEETSAQLATYSRTLFAFTLRLWSESRRRAEEIQKLQEAAANLSLSRPPQVRTGSVRSVLKVDVNRQQ